MTARGVLFEQARKLRLQARALTGLEALAVAAGMAVLIHGLGGDDWLVLLLGVASFLLVCGWRWNATPDNRLSEKTVARRLDDAIARLEDSTELLLRHATGLGRLERLQRERITARFSQLPASAIRIAAQRVSPAQLLPALAFLAAALVFAFFVGRQPGIAQVPGMTSEAVDDDFAVAVVAAELSVLPPAYTGLAGYRADADATVQEGSTLKWTIEVSGNPRAVSLGFDDDSVLRLREDADGTWHSDEMMARAALYRIETEPLSQSAEDLYRIRIVPDEAPLLNWLAPVNSVVDVAAMPGQAMTVRLRVRDDHGAAAVRAVLTLARGSGENVRFREQSRQMRLRDGQPKDAEYTLDLDFEELGMEPGDELFVSAEADDNREPESNKTRSATLIFRWAGGSSAAATMDGGLALDVLPEYFRSQRQIIIDTEKLIADADRLTRREFANQAQSLAQDQKLLRLRYGQFLGEEMVRDIGPGTDSEGAEDDHDDEHGHQASTAENAAEIDPMEYFVHSHDVAEQATLFDEKTKTLLKQSLENMWDAELHLRLAAPRQALPYENAALRYLKEVQQSSRVYLRRAGFSPPPVDEQRRLGGELDELREHNRRELDPPEDGREWRDLVTAHADPELTRSWFSGGGAERFGTFVAGEEISDELRLTVLELLDSLRRDPGCEPCRARLRGLALGQMPRVVPLPLPREGGNPALEAAFRQALPGADR
ncbi:MAG: hypothetical protein C0629_15960 [Chromatiales bacterium]|nr:MAG: hypothetical protein C0629_15960 [Chromatiales bacterium]